MLISRAMADSVKLQEDKSRVVEQGELEDLRRLLHQRISGNSNAVAAKSGNSYISETTTDRIEIPTANLGEVFRLRGGYRSATTSSLVIPGCRLSTYGTRAVSVAGPVCWNALPNYLKSSDLSFDCFKTPVENIFYFVNIDN